jgi:putative endonuclease
VSGAYLYILRCADGSYYVGTTRKSVEERVGEHNAGTFGGYTSKRRPVTVAFAEHFETITDAIEAERQLKGWSRAKKEAFMRGDWSLVSKLAKRRGPHPSMTPAVRESSCVERPVLGGLLRMRTRLWRCT